MSDQPEYFQILSSPVGQLKIMASADAIKAVHFCDGKDKMTSSPNRYTRSAIKQLKEYFAQQRTSFDLPLAPEGTDFQERVWQALLTIPYGKTISYLALARETGDEKAVRAVGGANGKNPIPILIPCHRVIGSNGQLTGYSGELWRKKKLLFLEGALLQNELIFTI